MRSLTGLAQYRLALSGLVWGSLLSASIAWGQGTSLGPPAPGTEVIVPPVAAAPTQTKDVPPGGVADPFADVTQFETIVPPAGGGVADRMPGSVAALAGEGEMLTILDVLEEALVNSPDIGASRAEIEAARGRKQQARADLLPPITFDYNEIFQKEKSVAFDPSTPPVTITPGNFRTFKIGSDWVVFSGGAMQAQVAIARMSEVAAQYQDEATINTVTGNTVLAYLNLLKAQELRTVADRTVELALEQERVAQTSFEAGAQPRVNVLRATSAVAAARQAQLQATNGIDLARSALLSMMGRPVDGPLNIAPVPRVLFDPPDLGESLQLAVQRRPELRAQQAVIEIDQQAVRAARAGYWPSLAVSSGFTHTVGAGAFADKDNWQVVLALRLNVWNWGKTAGAVRESRAKVVADRNRLERQMRSIELEVRQVLLTMSDARSRVEQAVTETEASAEALRIEELRYREGAGTFLELLDARRALSAAETNLVTAYYDNALAQAGWLGVTGGYLVEGQMNLPDARRPLPPLPPRPGEDLDGVLTSYGLDPDAEHKPVSDYTPQDFGAQPAAPAAAADPTSN